MITDIASYLRFFDSVRRRTDRDVAALPAEAAAWRPPAAGGEAGWSIGEIVGHIGGTWLPWLQTSAERFVALLRDTPQTWLTRGIEMVEGRPPPFDEPETDSHSAQLLREASPR